MAKKRSSGINLRGLIQSLLPQYWIDETRRDAVLKYLADEFKLGANHYRTERQYRDVFAKYSGVRPAYPPEMIAGLRELRRAARELFRRHLELGPIPPEATRRFIRWHDFYLAHDEAAAAELSIAEGYAEGATPDTGYRDRSFKREKRAWTRAQREMATLCDRLDMDLDQFRKLASEAEKATESEG